MSTLARTPRRLATVFGFALLLVVLVATGPLCFGLALGLDLAGRHRFASVRTLAMLIVYLACEVLGVALAAALWLRCLPSLWRGNEERFIDSNYRLQWWWASTLLGAARWLFDLRFDVAGIEAANASEGPLLVLARHASVADTLLAASLLSRPYGLRLRYVLKRELLADPCLDIVGNRLPNAFVERSGKDTARDVAAVKALGLGLGPHEGVLIYPEGTRATPALRERAIARLEASTTALPVQLEAARRLRHTLPPRVEGVLALLEADPHADLAFIAHAGFDRIRSLGDIRRGDMVGQVIAVRLFRCSRAEVPLDRAGRIAWLMDAWQRVDEEVGRQIAFIDRPRAV